MDDHTCPIWHFYDKYDMAMTPKPSAHQAGFTLIEVLIALVLFIVASAAVLYTVGTLYSSNARNKERMTDQFIAHDLSSIISGNPAILSSIDGETFVRGKNPSSQVAILSTWWNSAQLNDPFIQSVGTTTTPSACAPNSPCSVTITTTSKPSFSPTPIVRTYKIQEGF